MGKQMMLVDITNPAAPFLGAEVDESGRPIKHRARSTGTFSEPQRTISAENTEKYQRFVDEVRRQKIDTENDFADTDAKTLMIYACFPGRFPLQQRISCYRPEQIGRLFRGLYNYAQKRVNH